MDIQYNKLYSRNRIYLTVEQQHLLGKCNLIFAGSGLGSIIAECALRFGFNNICVIDGDKVEITNLNRQNYTDKDIGEYKAEVLAKRLLNINPQANITYKNVFLNEANMKEHLKGFDIAINAIDYTSDAPFIFDEICLSFHIPILHPYNFGFNGFVTIINHHTSLLDNFLQRDHRRFELRMARYVAQSMRERATPIEWFEKVIDTIEKEKGDFPNPQLSIGSYIAAGLCTEIMYKIVLGLPVNYFPQFYIK